MKCLWHVCKKESAVYQSKFCSINCKSKFYVDRRRKGLKTKAVDYKGGKCERCGYNKSIWALDFHHLDRKQKEFNVSRSGLTRSWERVKKEIDKCLLVCKNCHAEIEEEIHRVGSSVV